MNVKTEQMVPMMRKGGSYVLDAEFLIEEEKMEAGFPRWAVTKR